MASPRELVQAVANNLGVAEATVVVHDRNLAEAGLRTVAGRGRAAARVTPADAANLLIAVAMSRAAKDSAATVRRYAPLPRQFAPRDDEVGRLLHGADTFGGALAALIEGVPLQRARFDGRNIVIEVHMLGPNAQARINWEIKQTDENIVSGAEYEASRQEWQGGDFKFSGGFTLMTIGHVGELVANI